MAGSERLWESESESDYNDQIIFTTEKGKYILVHDQDCCETVVVKDVCGELKSLVGKKIIAAKECCSSCYVDSNGCEYGDNENYSSLESLTWTFYVLRTMEDTVTISFEGESNGYYPSGGKDVGC